MDEIIDGETGKIIDEPKKYEIIEYLGQEARFYPSTGAIMTQVGKRWQIVANKGGQVDFDAVAMNALREIKKEEAIQRGLETAALSLDMRTSGDMLARIVAFRAQVAATNPDRTGNNDAKFIFSLVAHNTEDSGEKPSARLDMDADSFAILIERLMEL